MSNTDNSGERRQFTRIHFDADTVLLFQHKRFHVQLADISLNGMLILAESPLPMAISDTALVEVELGELKLEFPAHLMHHEQSHYGFRMDNLDIDTMTHLRRLVELNLGDEALFERELEQLIPSR